MMLPSWSEIANLATAAAALIAAFGLWQSGRQLKLAGDVARDTRLFTQGQFFLAMEDLLAQHADVNLAFRPGGRWSAGAGPCTASEWAQVEAYLGLFERVYAWVKKGILSIEDVEYFYGYRILNVANNPIVYTEKLKRGEAQDWLGFCSLVKDVESARRSRLPDATTNA